ncbi:MAG: hypothetical protein A2341_19965 [Deltaproteobacteria bacterium RIFOXYB12_FULL_58_9]|nr:MAG: hypothetical protein A2341_19965 [Deltaproteobacteria bacterium RIFOXYB12_FULL_58_9]
MPSRVWTNLLFVASVLVLVAVGYYFANEYWQIEKRRQGLADLNEIASQEGPCAALAGIAALKRPLDFDFAGSVEALRRTLAVQIVGEDDVQAQAALLNADRDGLVGRTLCEQIGLTRELGESHPVLELLRFTREGGDACADPLGLSQALQSLTSHRPQMLHALMDQVAQLHCAPPWLAANVAEAVVDELRAKPDAMDDLEPLRIAKFLVTWAPVRAAQLSCLLETDGRASKVATAIDCTPYHKRHVLPRYRTKVEVVGGGATPLPAGSDVFLLWQEGDRCQVRPELEPPVSLTLPCGSISLRSEVHVAVLVEAVEFGLARASLVAGVVTFDGATNQVTPTVDEPDLKSWYGYSREGQPLGMAHTVRLKDLADKYGEDVPNNPLRAFCHKSGARYCYDVDWAQVVGLLQGDPVVYLSRPMSVILQPEAFLSDDVVSGLFAKAFGRSLGDDELLRVYRLVRGGYLLVESRHAGVELRWRLGASDSWNGASFGALEGGTPTPTARLLAVLDLEADGRPELLLQRIERKSAAGEITDSTDEITMLALDKTGKRLRPLTKLIVHEY